MRSILNEKNLKSKKILLRLDLNVPLDNGNISDTTRIDKILPTLNFLIQQKTKIIILSHVGRPKGKAVKELSLRPIGEDLRKNEDYLEAINAFTQAIRLDSNYAIAYHNRGVSYHKLGNYQKAIECHDSNEYQKGWALAKNTTVRHMQVVEGFSTE